MLVVGLVQGSEPRPPEDPPAPRPGRSWRVPWASLAWVAVWCCLLALVSVADSVVGAPAGYVVLVLAVALAIWRVERWCGRQYWHGLREYQA